MHKTSLRRLRDNVVAGGRLARFRPVSLQDFHVSSGQLILLATFNLCVAFGCDLLESLPDPAFNFSGFAMRGFGTLMLLLASTLTALWVTRRIGPLAMAVMVFSCMPFLSVTVLVIMLLAFHTAEQGSWVQLPAYLFSVALIFAVLARPAVLEPGMNRLRMSAVIWIFLLTWFLPVWFFTTENYFWYRNYDSGAAVDEYAAYRDLDVEALYYRQPALMADTLDALLPERPGTDDLYFIGFAGHAYQDVFLKEIRFARELFDSRFDTAGRSLLLANHLSTRDSLPIASRSNLRAALASIGRRMDTGNDVLVMFLTSHGSAQELSVDYWTLGLNDLTPAQLRADLDASGIRWRIVMISACHSGAFIEALGDPYTLVLTAAAGDRTSFGCGNDSDLTYFGEALLKHQLAGTHSFEAAFDAAAAEIAERERREGLEPSRPQIFVGAQIRSKLAGLVPVLESRLDTDRLPHSVVLSAHAAAAGVD